MYGFSILYSFLAGGFIGFLLRPTVPILNFQLPFSPVLTRGYFLEQVVITFRPLAETSFNYLLACAVCGLILGFIVAIILYKINMLSKSIQKND